MSFDQEKFDLEMLEEIIETISANPDGKFSERQKIELLHHLMDNQIPKGRIAVPIEPNEDMVSAWYRVKNGHHFHDEPVPEDTSDYAAYRAMMANVPK